MLESIAVLVLVSLCSIGMGVYQFESSHAFRVLWQFISHDPNILTGEKYIVWDIRTSRVVMGILIGSMLAFSGTLLQGMFKNPLATGDLSEMELLATQVGNGTQILNNNLATLLSEIQKLGKVMAWTRNEECLHERKGTYLNPDFSNPHAQLFVGEDIDLRIFLNSWKYGFSVVEGDKKSFQFFGIDGLALHKIYLGKTATRQNLMGFQKNTAQKTKIHFLIYKPQHQSQPKNQMPKIDVEGFQNLWKALKDTPDFFMLTRKFGVSRTQALRLAPEGFAQKIENFKVVNLLENASEKQIPIMVFVGNRGIIQIHTGGINKVLWHQQWFNVMDPDFNLHLDTVKIAETWIVKKPTEDGEVTSIEVFNKEGDFIVQFLVKENRAFPNCKSGKTL